MEKILIGSRYFFSCYDDFVGIDTDELAIIDTTEFKQMKQISGQGKCLFLMRRHASKEDYIDWALKSQVGMVIGKFLVPEFCKEIGFTVSDLERLRPLIAKLDDKHKYEEVIFNSYLQNGDFILTSEQRDAAYLMYRESRAAAFN